MTVVPVLLTAHFPALAPRSRMVIRAKRSFGFPATLVCASRPPHHLFGLDPGPPCGPGGFSQLVPCLPAGPGGLLSPRLGWLYAGTSGDEPAPPGGPGGFSQLVPGPPLGPGGFSQLVPGPPVGPGGLFCPGLGCAYDGTFARERTAITNNAIHRVDCLFDMVW